MQNQEITLPLVTIITSVYNDCNNLQNAINSILLQSYKNIEYIIIDGGSTDGTLEVIKRNSDCIKFWVSEPDKGIYDAWNKGLKQSKGNWIAFLGADDEYKPDAISNYVAHLNKVNLPNLDYISSKAQLVNNIKQNLQVIGKPWKWDKFRLYMTVAHVGSLHSRTFFEKYGLYNLNYKIIGDYEMLLRAKGNLKATFLDKITVNMQVGGISNQNINSIWETHKAIMQTGYTGALEGYLWLLKRLAHWYLYKLNNCLR